ncbi:MAG: Chromosome segregation DNA-binding protein [Parcubacteria group bacterium GW2011_GWA2_53_21]|nr:MAG: Chromosome segregation DNA-binding protein [Parcubacteria group bacterium GW2011_GWA2_53_21]
MSGLSRGLGSLIPQTGSLTSQVLPKTKEGFEEVDVTLVKENPYQPRTHFSASDLEDLMISIKEHGILVPLIVTRLGSGYELIAGERRLRAARNLESDAGTGVRAGGEEPVGSGEHNSAS